MRPLLQAALLVLIAAACGSPADSNQNHHDHNAAARPAKDRADSLYKAVIALHDEAMPKMGKLMGYKKSLEQKIDSVTALMERSKDESLQQLRNQYKDLLARVSAAEKGMNDWMSQFEPDPKLPSKAEIENYFDDQRQKAQKMRDDFMSALDSAQSKLGF